MVNGLMMNSSLQSSSLCFSEVSGNNTKGLLSQSQELQAAKQHSKRLQRLLLHILFRNEQKGYVCDFELGCCWFKLVIE